MELKWPAPAAQWRAVAPVLFAASSGAPADSSTCTVRWLAACMGRDQALLRFGARARSPGDHDLLVADTRRLAELLGSAPPQRLHAAADLVDLLAGGSP